MSVIKTGTTTTTGYVVESDTNGNLVIQTGSTPTTALTLGSDQSVTFTGSLIDSAGTANGVLYLNGSKAQTTGSVLTFDGAQLGVNGVTVGRGAGAVSTNTAVGASALAANTTASNNTAVGYQAGYSNTTGEYMVAVGAGSLYSSNGVSNTGLGWGAGYSNTTGTNNLFSGTSAGYANTTGAYNTALGAAALRYNTTASNNTAVGYQAGYSNQTGAANVFIGHSAGINNTTGTVNTFVGASSGDVMTTGTKNTILGRYSGNQGGLDIRTASNYIVLSDGDGNPKIYYDGNNNSMHVPAAQQITAHVSPGFSLAANQYTDILYIGAGGYGAIISGILTVFSTYAGAVTQNSYFVNTIGDGSGTGVSMISQGNYSTASPFILYDRGTSALGAGSRVLSVYNASGQSVSVYYSFTPVGRANSASYYDSLTNNGSAGAGTGTPSGTAVYFGQGQATVLAQAVTFPATQVASTDANTLDDYEEGTYTPTVIVTSGTPTYAYQQGYYTKIGRQVFGGGIIGITNSNTLTGAIRVSIPFTASAGNYGYTGGFTSDGAGFTWPVTQGGGSFYSVVLQVGPGESRLTFTGVGAVADSVTYTSSGVGASWYFRFSFSIYV